MGLVFGLGSCRIQKALTVLAGDQKRDGDPASDHQQKNRKKKLASKTLKSHLPSLWILNRWY